MTENNKPEWIQIAENDGPVIPAKASKALPLAAVFAAALILGIGTVVGQVQEVAPATAVEAASAQTIVSNDITASTPAQRIANPDASTAVTATSALINPAIAQLPTKGDDDEDDEDEDDEDEGDDD